MKKDKQVYTSFEEVAYAYKLCQKTAKRFLYYMKERWSGEEKLQCATGYASEWAMRFQTGREYTASDMAGLAVLRKMDEQKKGVCCLGCGKMVTKLEDDLGECFDCGGKIGSEEEWGADNVD